MSRGFVLGRKAMLKLNEIEGLSPQPEDLEMLAAFDRDGLRPDERRRRVRTHLSVTTRSATEVPDGDDRTGPSGGDVDPYLSAGTSVLRNRAGLSGEADLERLEFLSTMVRADEAFPVGAFDSTHYKAIHHHLFQDVYDWAGRPRVVRLFKNGSAFCFPENIESEMARLFREPGIPAMLEGLNEEAFSLSAARFLSELNAIHLFREGNGRTQTIFLAMLAAEAGRPLMLEHLDRHDWIRAMIHSFHHDELLLAVQIRSLMNR